MRPDRAARARLRILKAERARQARAARAALRRRAQAQRPPRPWRRRALLALLALLLLLLWPCRQEEPLPPAPEAVVPSAAGEAAPAAAAAPAGPAVRVARRDRPGYALAEPTRLAWLPAFRLQVAARSPRLAACFEGTPRPGSLKWTTSVEPGRGLVSDHALEPTLASDPLTARQRACLVEVLAAPPYQLEADTNPATPVRVGLVIEF